MRVALRLASRLCLSIGLLSLAVSCAMPGKLRVEELGDVSRHRTWDWLVPKRGHVDSEMRGDPVLEAEIAREVQSALQGLGFRHDPRRPDLRVFFRVGIQRQLVKYNRKGAMKQLSSLHDSPSYSVQANEVEHHYYEIAELRILLVDPEERRVIWRGVLERRYPEEFAPHIREAVSELVGHMPSPRTRGPTQTVPEEAPPGLDVASHP